MSDFAAFGDSSLPTGDGSTGGGGGGDPFSGGGGMDLSGLGMGGPFQSAFPSGFNYMPPNAPSQVVGTAQDPATQAAYQGQQNAPRPPQPQTPNWVQDAYRSLLGGQQNAASPSMQAMAQQAQQGGEGWGPGLKGLFGQASPQDIAGLSAAGAGSIPPSIVSGPAPPTGAQPATGQPTAAQTAGLTGGVTQDPTIGGGQAPTALPPITVTPDQPDTATGGTPPDAKTVRTAPVTGGPTGAIPGDVTQGTATPSAATTSPPSAPIPPQSPPVSGNQGGQAPFGGAFGGPQGPLGGILGMIVQAIGGLLGIDVGDFMRQLGMPDGQNMAGNQDWRSMAGRPGDPWYGKPMTPGYGPDPLQPPPPTTSPGQPTPGGTPSAQPGGFPGTVTPGARDPSMQRGDPFTTGTPSRGTLGETPPAGTPPAAGTQVATTRPTQQVGGATTAPQTRFNLMRGGQYGAPGQNLTSINTPGGPVQVHSAAAPHFQGFINDMQRAGAPMGGQYGGYGGVNRMIAGTNQRSQHAWGNAIDVNQSGVHGHLGDNPALRQWAQANPQQFRSILNKWGISNGGDFGDWGHFEWNGGGQTGLGLIAGAMPTGPGGLPRTAAAPSGNAAAATSQDPQQRSTATHAGLAQARQPFAAQLQNPNTQRLLAASTAAEVGGQGPLAEQAYIESVLNRAAARNMPLDRVLSARNYYPGTTRGKLGRTPSAADTQRIQQITQRVLAGSNVSNFATGNASGRASFNKGPQTWAAGSGPRSERFGTEGPDRAWAQRMQGGSQAAQQLTPRMNESLETVRGVNEATRQIGTHADWNKFEREARPSTNVEDRRPDMGPASFSDRFGSPIDFNPRMGLDRPGAGTEGYGGGVDPRGSPHALVGALPPAPETTGRYAIDTGGPQPYNRNVDDLGRPIPDVTLPQITVKPDTAQAQGTAKGGEDVPLPRSDPRKGQRRQPKGMTKSHRASIQRRQAQRRPQAPPPTPMLSPYGGGSATGPNVQPGQPGYERAMQYYYGRGS